MDSAPTCATCGASLTADAAFCAQCGKSVHREPGEGPTTLERLSLVLADRYRVERQVGKGGMATVFLAHDLRHERRVALKVLHPELAASVGAERFDREIKVSAKLQHPHILTLYDSGVADGLMFYVMPFVEGESLRDRLERENMLPVDDALRIIVEVADALGYAHGLGIVHRDIKPENVLLQGGHALVADFGIARAVTSADDSKLTKTGTAVGTPLYMSPEQAHGNEVGPSGDLYSLACVGYEMLTGQPPFTGANPRAIMARHTMEAVPSLRVVRDTVPEEVEEALLWALAKVPADRPQTAAQFVEALGAPIAAGRVTRRTMTPARLTAARPALRRPVWQRPAVIAGGVGLLVLGGVAAALALLPGGGAEPEDELDRRTIAVLYFEDRSGGELSLLADGLTEGLIDELSAVSQLRVISRGGVGQFRGSALPLDSVARVLRAGTLVRGSVAPEGPDIRVRVSLLDGHDVERGNAGFRLPAGNVLTVRDSLVRQVAALVRRRLGEDILSGALRAGTRNADAWVLLQRAERLRRQLDSATVSDSAAERIYRSADSLLAAAERLDGRWVEPVVTRGLLAYRRSRLAVDSLPLAERWIVEGLSHAERALALERNHAAGRELRGTLRYWRWLLQLERDPARAERLLHAAKADLDSAVLREPMRASAWATLSHLLNQRGTGVDVYDAARRAYEADAYLGNAELILQRLFFAAYDLALFGDAQRWCDDGERRFPASPRFVECHLWMLTTPGPSDSAEVSRAWGLVARVDSLSPGDAGAFGRLSARMLVAGVLARTGLPDSARQVVTRSKGDPVVDQTRDLANMAAFVYTLLGDTTDAVAQLRLYLAANPGRARALAADPGWWFRPIVAHPGFRQAVGLR